MKYIVQTGKTCETKSESRDLDDDDYTFNIKLNKAVWLIDADGFWCNTLESLKESENIMQ